MGIYICSYLVIDVFLWYNVCLFVFYGRHEYTSNYKENYPWVKGVLAILFGIIFYLIIGLPHLNGGRNK